MDTGMGYYDLARKLYWILSIYKSIRREILNKYFIGVSIFVAVAVVFVGIYNHFDVIVGLWQRESAEVESILRKIPEINSLFYARTLSNHQASYRPFFEAFAALALLSVLAWIPFKRMAKSVRNVVFVIMFVAFAAIGSLVFLAVNFFVSRRRRDRD